MSAPREPLGVAILKRAVGLCYMAELDARAGREVAGPLSALCISYLKMNAAGAAGLRAEFESACLMEESFFSSLSILGYVPRDGRDEPHVRAARGV